VPIVDFADAMAAGEQNTGGLLILAVLSMHAADATVLYAVTEVEYVDPVREVVFPPVYEIALPPTAQTGVTGRPVKVGEPGLTTRSSPPAAIGLLNGHRLVGVGGGDQPFAWDQGSLLDISLLPASPSYWPPGQPARMELELFDAGANIVSQVRIPFQQIGVMLEGVGPNLYDTSFTAVYTVSLLTGIFR